MGHGPRHPRASDSPRAGGHRPAAGDLNRALHGEQRLVECLPRLVASRLWRPANRRWLSAIQRHGPVPVTKTPSVVLFFPAPLRPTPPKVRRVSRPAALLRGPKPTALPERMTEMREAGRWVWLGGRIADGRRTAFYIFALPSVSTGKCLADCGQRQCILQCTVLVHMVHNGGRFFYRTVSASRCVCARARVRACVRAHALRVCQCVNVHMRVCVCRCARVRVNLRMCACVSVRARACAYMYPCFLVP